MPLATLSHPMVGDEDNVETLVELRATADSSRTPNPRIDAPIKLSTMLEAMPVSAVLLDRDRRMVAANQRMISEFGAGLLQGLVGRRLGESLGCQRADESPAGCGTSPGCAWCGAFQAVTEAQLRGAPASTEWRIPVQLDRAGAIDVEVIATPLVIDGERMSLVTLRDISAEKRRRVLERIFFHDVLNTAGGICGIAHLLAESEEPSSDEEFKGMLLSLSEQLIEEINSQRQLMAAETGELQVNVSEVVAADALRNLRSTWASSPLGMTRTIVLGSLPDAKLETDITLLRRILGNMIKNALEATAEGEAITLWAEDLGDWIVFAVHNPGEIPEKARHQVFLRSFSTKGEGRGIGTYSIRLLGEKYLGGKVGFSSTAARGTTFTVRLPKFWPLPPRLGPQPRNG